MMKTVAQRMTGEDVPVRTPHVWPVPVLVFVGLIPFALARLAVMEAATLAAVAVAVQVWMLVQLRRAIFPRRWGFALVVGVLWVLYFPLKLLVIASDQTYIALHPSVVGADQNDLKWVAVTTSAALMLFVLGVLAGQSGPSPTWRADARLSDPAVLRGLAIFGLAVNAMLVLTGLQSGVLKQVALVLLIGIAGLAYVSRGSGLLLAEAGAFASLAAILGLLTGFKEDFALPLVAVALGVASARRLGKREVLGLTLAVSMVFVVVQGHRLSVKQGLQQSYLSSAISGLYEHDLVTGRSTVRKSTPEAAVNLMSAVARRFTGADSILVVRAKTPAFIPFQDGNTIWQPMVSVVPGAASILDLEFTSLSLGRYFAVNFWSLTDTDTSSQALTVVGDLYLNGGLAAILFGMPFFGWAAGRLDRAWPAQSALGVGALVYIGSSLAGIERNVAYVTVNTGIRVGVFLLLLGLLAHGPHLVRTYRR